MEKTNIQKTITLNHHILVRSYDKNRCSPDCYQVHKENGVYHCDLFDEDVDRGDDEERNDYHFERCDECKEKAV